MNNVEITKLILQRAPIIMVDELVKIDGDKAITCLTIRADNFFIDADGLLAETGLLEHIAQSASAVAGHRALAAGENTPPVGYIGEIKNFHCYRRPQIDDELHTTITMGIEIAGVTIITGEIFLSGDKVADTQMKIFISRNN